MSVMIYDCFPFFNELDVLEIRLNVLYDIVDYFVITNYSVGTGRNCILPSPIILESHYLSMMKLNNGMYNVHYALSDNGKGYIQHVEKRYARYLLSGYKIMVPEYLFKINAPRL